MNGYGTFGNGTFSSWQGWRQVWRSMTQTTARFLVQIGGVLLLISILIFLFPRVVGWMLAFLFLMGAVWFFLQAYRVWRAERRWTSSRIYDVQDFYETP